VCSPDSILLSNSYSDAPISELSLELLLLQVVLPSLLDQGHTRTWFKSLVVCWTRCVANLLNLNSYLLGNEDLEDKVGVMLSIILFQLPTFFYIHELHYKPKPD